MRPRFALLALLAAIFVSLWSVASAQAQQPATTYDLAGQVVNSVTGEPIGGALVEVYSPNRQAQFSGSNGAFDFTGLPRGDFSVVARKPGFFNQRESGNRTITDVASVPTQTSLVVKLVPEAIIFGQVTAANGQPLERILVTAQHWEIEDGRRQLQRTGVGITDDQGNFRIAELRPGTYFLSFAPFGTESVYGGLGPKKAGSQGYGAQFYPGVADFESATPITLTPGMQFHADQALTTQATFAITGRIVGANGARGISVAVIDSEGNAIQRVVRVDPSTGEFQVSGIPAGKYVLTARAQRFVISMSPGLQLSPQRPLAAYLPISVTSDVSGVVLALGPGISIPIRVDDETRNDNSGNPHRVLIRFFSTTPGRFFERGTVAPRDDRGQTLPAAIESVVPGTYSVEARPFGPFYVADLRCGTVDLLRDDLTVGSTGSMPPIDVTLRDDGAQLTGSVTQNGKPIQAGVVIYSPDYPQRSQITGAGENGSFFLDNLAPGTYEVFAASNPYSIEFRNPAAVQNYLAHATSVTLGAGGQTSVQLELPSADEDQP
ncbi:MAG TPA: carboxypeptidase-like regulatory domain-containing protein [Candidatus Acidoferrum sp.]|nr:carboxypeptidase-like regulatory domain-containing protein [Candidatus Acidoferrum sp.]